MILGDIVPDSQKSFANDSGDKMRPVALLALFYFSFNCHDILFVLSFLNQMKTTSPQATELFKQSLDFLKSGLIDESHQDTVSIIILPSKLNGKRTDELLVEDVFGHLAAAQYFHAVLVVTNGSKQQLKINGNSQVTSSVSIFAQDLETIGQFLRKGTPFASRSSAAVKYVSLYTIGSNAMGDGYLEKKLKELQEWLPRNTTLIHFSNSLRTRGQGKVLFRHWCNAKQDNLKNISSLAKLRPGHHHMPWSAEGSRNCHGTQLKTTYINLHKNWFIKSRTNSGGITFDGSEFRLSEILRKTFNFTVVYLNPETGAPPGERLENGTWTGVTGMLYIWNKTKN